jgi:hypothetical protein
MPFKSSVSEKYPYRQLVNKGSPPPNLCRQY